MGHQHGGYLPAVGDRFVEIRVVAEFPYHGSQERDTWRW